MRNRHRTGPRPPAAPAGRAVLLLLWLLVALMPLRAVSPWLMDRPAQAATAGLAMPCHGDAAMAGMAHAAHPTGLADTADDGQSLPSPGDAAGADACHACDLCHAAMAGPVIAAAAALPTAASAIGAPAAGPRLAALGDGIFRPPRG